MGLGAPVAASWLDPSEQHTRLKTTGEDRPVPQLGTLARTLAALATGSVDHEAVPLGAAGTGRVDPRRGRSSSRRPQ